MNFHDVAIASVKGNDYRIYFWYMSKNDAINIMNNFSLSEKKDLFFHYVLNMSGQLIIKEIEV